MALLAPVPLTARGRHLELRDLGCHWEQPDAQGHWAEVNRINGKQRPVEGREGLQEVEQETEQLQEMLRIQYEIFVFSGSSHVSI